MCSSQQAYSTPHELEIVRLVAHGLHNKEIARKLAITESTVKTHLHNLYRKLDMDTYVGLTPAAPLQSLI
jgi:DNA-binding NarL/FixJ family response regulator